MKSIICFGDGGLNIENPLMDLYVIAQSNKKCPKVCFLPTASGDNGGYISFFNRLFKRYPCDPCHFSFFNPSTKDVEDFILSCDILYVGGGHTRSMLAIWKDFGFDKILKKAYDNGVLLAGGSAGSVCWFDECITDSIPGELSVMPCLGLLNYSNCPHYSSKNRRIAYESYVSSGGIKPGYAIDDFAAIHFENGSVLRALSQDKGAEAHFVSNKGSSKEISVSVLDMLDLENEENQQSLILNYPAFSL